MSATELQQQRMKSYFVDAAKEILRGEGLRAASARNIAERAGYSYATLYNYFDDLPALIFESVRDFQKEIEELTASQAAGAETAEEKIRRGITAWINYFVQYPGIFELFFLERIGEIGGRSEIADTVYNSIVPAVKPGLEELAAAGGWKKDQTAEKLDTIRYQITGLLLYFGNRRNPADYAALIEKLNRQLSILLA